MGRDEAKGYQKEGNMGRLKPMGQARDETAMGQQRDGPMGEAVGSQRAQEGRAKKDWIMGLTLAQLLEDSVENKYMELYQVRQRKGERGRERGGERGGEKENEGEERI